MSENKHELSIGEVSEATGVSVHTLRQWERRYGHPKSIKKSSGHRRYSLAEVARVRLVSHSLALGLRAKNVVPLGYADLLKVLEDSDVHSPILSVEQWLNCVKSWDQNKLVNMCHSDWNSLGPVEFLNQRVIPFLIRVGESWLLNEITIAQEHFFSELLESFLAEKWRKLNENNSRSLYILATPEGESHCLGLHMCALILTVNKKKVMFLGAATPYEDIISASHSAYAHGVCLSFSSNYSRPGVGKKLLNLSSELGESTKLIIGGKGAPEKIKGVLKFNNLNEFSGWLKK